MLAFRSSLALSRAYPLAAIPTRNFRQMNNLHEVNYTTQMELQQRTSKYLERTDRVYKPSKTLEFDRSGELLLWSCDNIKNSIIYFKYPYCFYDCLMPMSWYFLFVNPFLWKWQVSLSFFYMSHMFAWLPHAMYIMNLNKKMHKMHLLRGGKYVKFTSQTAIGDTFVSWGSNCDFHLLTEDYTEFADKEETEFLTKEGQIAYET